MNRLHVKSESLPTRCEVCHQADCFDAATGACSRCSDVVAGIHPGDNPTQKNDHGRRRRSSIVMLWISIFCFVGFGAGVWEIGSIGQTTPSPTLIKIEEWRKTYHPRQPEPSNEHKICRLVIRIPRHLSNLAGRRIPGRNLRTMRGSVVASTLTFERMEATGAITGENYFGLHRPNGEWELIYISPNIGKGQEPRARAELIMNLRVGLSPGNRVTVQTYVDPKSKRTFASSVQFDDWGNKTRK
jgi:hypothetical protein